MSRFSRRSRAGRASVFSPNGTLPLPPQWDDLDDLLSPVSSAWASSAVPQDDFSDGAWGETPYLRSLSAVEPSYGPRRTFPLKGAVRSYSFGSLQVRVPARTRMCLQRKSRRESLFALSRIGFRRSSPGGGGRYRRTQDSQWRC